MRLSAKNIIGTSIIVLVGLFAFSAMHASSASSADQLLREAYEKRTEARRAHCVSIGVKIALAYTGDKEAQEKIPESSAWFLNEYGQTHDVACLAEDLPFGVGGK